MAFQRGQRSAIAMVNMGLRVAPGLRESRVPTLVVFSGGGNGFLHDGSVPSSHVSISHPTEKGYYNSLGVTLSEKVGVSRLVSTSGEGRSMEISQIDLGRFICLPSQEIIAAAEGNPIAE
ncbi:hypothetical protein NE237_020666 [Protea cynaroides]|uniref:Uncharacterized protein n=1 Tax=Protea cynaroides TaxID=273540 RepID=A0A9Q0H6E8_9MAGN|nr:hypothetical protein NE237_020666 [Protea cynaroides]